MMDHLPITKRKKYQRLPLMVIHETTKNQGFYKPILADIKSLLDSMTERHNRVTCFTLTLTFPVGFDAGDDNRYMEEFLKKYIHYLDNHAVKSKNHKVDAQFFSVREQVSSPNQHYHIAIMVNGNAIISAYKHQLKAVKLWTEVLGVYADGQVHFNKIVSEPGDYGCSKLKRLPDGTIQNYESTFKYLSYFAKVFSKYKPLRYKVKLYDSSQEN